MEEATAGFVNLSESKPLKVTLTRGAKGGYQWEIRLYGDAKDEVLAEIKKIDEQLRTSYLLTPMGVSE
jgi:hypothetical protein